MAGTISYVEPKSWIKNDKIRDVILFGKAYEPERYNKVIEACQLEPDLKILPAYDMTEIGEQGINLSGGQKARVSLARAVYADADLICMDDPVSALDAHVRKNIFKQVFKGVCKDKTRILCTHAIDFLHLADKVVIMDNGKITACGAYKDLQDNKHLVAIMEAHEYQNQLTLEQTKQMAENPKEEKTEKKEKKDEEKPKEEAKAEKKVDENKGKLGKDADAEELPEATWETVKRSIHYAGGLKIIFFGLIITMVSTYTEVAKNDANREWAIQSKEEQNTYFYQNIAICVGLMVLEMGLDFINE